jgi:hypothetical protein
MTVGMVTFNSCLLECPVHLLHLTIDPEMVWLGQTMVSTVCVAGPYQRGRVGSPAVGPE